MHILSTSPYSPFLSYFPYVYLGMLCVVHFFSFLYVSGIMDPAFFVGKVVLLKWLNDFFDAGYSKVEQTCTGAMHCQIMDAIYPSVL
jgi:hypothetical protein